MSIPVVFLIFANPQNDLTELMAERKGIEKALAEADKHNYIRCLSESATNTQDIFNVFDRYRGHIKIVHFGGHASSEVLALHHQKIPAKGLATLLQTENNINGIELVFLNACATAGQVKALLEAGVKSVIATTAKIKDDQASQFAQQFYKSLAAGAPVQEAYQKATSLLLMEEKNPPAYMRGMEIVGGLDSLAHLTPQNELPWGLYMAGQGEADFKLDLENKKSTADGSSHNVYNYGDVKNQINNPNINGDLNLS